jgi:multidrug resistance efflux pump
MKRIGLVFSGIVLCFSLFGVRGAYAQNAIIANEIASDKKAVKNAVLEKKENAQTAHSEEATLRGQIKEANASGDKATADQLKAQLKAMHKGNVSEKKSDKKSVHKAKKELKKDIKKKKTESN